MIRYREHTPRGIDEWKREHKPAQTLQSPCVHLIREQRSIGAIEGPRQLGEMHRVEVEEVTPSTHAGDGGVDGMQLPGGHDATAI